MGFLQGKRSLIVGLANKHSIAWGIAKAMYREGAEVVLTYQNQRLKSRAEQVAAELDSSIITLQCDVSSDTEIETLFTILKTRWTWIDILVHAVAYAPSEALTGSFIDSVNRKNFQIAHDISSYSFTALAKAAQPLMSKRQAALLTLTYLGSTRTLPNYNIMGLAKASLEANVRYLAYDLGPDGIRVNAISAGPIRTLAASGIKNFRSMLSNFELIAPLHKCVSIDEIGNTAAFLCSDLASGITGEIIHVDGGFSTVAMKKD